MPGRDFDADAELRPLGEATHVPDHEFGTNCTDRRRDPRRSRSPADDGSTPECRSCGASVPADRATPSTGYGNGEPACCQHRVRRRLVGVAPSVTWPPRLFSLSRRSFPSEPAVNRICFGSVLVSWAFVEPSVARGTSRTERVIGVHSPSTTRTSSSCSSGRVCRATSSLSSERVCSVTTS